MLEETNVSGGVGRKGRSEVDKARKMVSVGESWRKEGKRGEKGGKREEWGWEGREGGPRFSFLSVSTADKGHCGGSYCGGLTYARVYAYVEPIWMCAPDRSRTLSSHRRGIRADPWATRCIFIRRRKRSLRLRIFPARFLVALLYFAISPVSASTIVVRQVSNLSYESIVRATLIRSRQVRERRRRIRWHSASSNYRVKRDAISSKDIVASRKIRSIFSNDTETHTAVAPLRQNYATDAGDFASSNTTASIACIASCRIGWNRKENSRSVGWRSGGAEWRGVALLAGSREPAAAMPDGRRRTDRQECRSRCSVARCICHMVNGFRVARHHR